MQDDSNRTVREVIAWVKLNKPPGVNPDCRKEQQRILDSFVAEYGDMPLGQLRSWMLLAFVNGRPSLKSEWTKKRWAKTVGAAFSFAARLGYIPYHPLVGLRMSQGGMGRDWKPDEVQTMLRNAPPYFRRLLLFLKLTGARQGEARQLRWEHINFDKAVITLAKHKTAHVTKQPRKIYLAPAALKLLHWLRRHRNDPDALRVRICGGGWAGVPKYRHCRYADSAVVRFTVNGRLQQKTLGRYGSPESRAAYAVLVAMWSKQRVDQRCPKRIIQSDFVFTNAEGRQWTCGALTKRFRVLRRRAKLPDDCKLHSGRHYFCTVAISRGLDLSVVAALAGHATIQTTQKYTHMTDKTALLLDAVARAVQNGHVSPQTNGR